jgi:hypothetical protein
MDMTFTGLYYLIYTLILDLLIAIQFFAISIMQKNHYKYQKFNQLSPIKKFAIFAIINIIGVYLLYLSEELYMCIIILIGEIIIVCLVAGTIIIIMYSV